MVFGTVKASVVNLKRRGRRNKVGTPRLRIFISGKASGSLFSLIFRTKGRTAKRPARVH